MIGHVYYYNLFILSIPIAENIINTFTSFF